MQPLARDEVRVFTLDDGDSARTRQAARVILAALLDRAVDGVEIAAGPKGKPHLVTDPELQFSISHSRAVSMIAITRVAPVGVDIERVRAVPHAEMILKRFFSPEQIATILSDDNSALRFVEAWTRAEATVKVRGASVWEVATPDPNVTVRPLVAPDGFAAAVAVSSTEWSMTQADVSVRDLI